MKNKLQTVLYALMLVGISSCSDDDGLTSVSVNAPENISADFSIKQDNSGDVTIFPSAEGANSFIIDFGDGSAVSDEFTPGNNILHTYAEGTYQLGISAKNIAGAITKATQELVVSFSAPENLGVTITKDPSNPFLVGVSASAQNAASYEAYFGEEAGESPQPLMDGETINYTYSTTGIYTITVVALSGGSATTMYTEEVEIVDPLVFPIDFESQTVDYAFYNFGGGEETNVPLVNNPSANDVNSSATVASYTKVAGSETWAGTSRALSAPIDFGGRTFIAMDVYSPTAGIPVLFKIEKAGDNTVFVEATTSTTVANEWETLYFDMSAINPDETYSVIALFFNFNISGTGETYYFDNLRVESPTVIELPVTFEEAPENYGFMEFGGAPTVLVANPDQGDANPSNMVAQVTKVAGAQTYAGSFFDLNRKVDFTVDSKLSMKVWSPQAGIPIILKFEDPADGNINTEATATTTVANAWETITFDFSAADAGQNWQRMIVFFNAGTTGSGNIYYYDDVSYAGDQPVSGPKLPLTFDGEGAAYEWVNFGGATSEVVDNPDISGINTSAKVTQLIKGSGAEVWAGSNIRLDGTIDFSVSTTFSMKTWSPVAGANVLLKIEGTDNSEVMEVQATTSVANAWEELTFDFSGVQNIGPLNVVTVFMNFGEIGQGNTYYFDDIQLIN